MLADTIIAFPDEPASALLLPGMRESYRALGRRIATSNRFVLNRDAVMLVHDIGESKPSRFLAALDICRLPFPTLWVEFAFKDRTDWLTSMRARGVRLVTREDTEPPSRLGLYMEALDKEGRDILIHPAWSHHDGSVSICHLTFRINTGEAGPPSEEDRARVLAELERAPPPWAKDPAELEAAIQMEARVKHEVPPYLMPTWEDLERTLGRTPKLENLIDLARHDLLAEFQFALGLLTTLNSRNVIQYGPSVSYEKLNKARAKQKKPPLLDHREIRLNLSKVQRNRLGEGGGGGSADLHAHLVRGHFKLRKTGLYWWSPFVRGSRGEVPKTRTYVVSV